MRNKIAESTPFVAVHCLFGPPASVLAWRWLASPARSD